MSYGYVRHRARALITIAAVLGLSPAVLAQGAVPSYEGVDQIPEIRLSFTEPYAQEGVNGHADQVFVDYVREASQGRIQIEVFWGGSLMGVAENAEGIASGLADIGFVSPIYNPASFPIANWVTLLANQATGGIQAGGSVFGAAHYEWALTNPELNKEFHDRGLHIIGALSIVAFDMLCNKPVQTLADAKGKRARAAGIVFSKEVEALGMVAVPLVPAEMYEAFSRGIVDCITLHPMGYQDFGLLGIPGELYFVNMEFAGWNSSYYSVNKDKWDAMPPVAQQIIKDGFMAAFGDLLDGFYDRHQSFGKIIESGALKTIQPDEALRGALLDQQKQAVIDMVKQPPEGVADPQKFVDDYLALLQKWRNIVRDDLGIPDGPVDVAEKVAGWQQPMDYTPVVERLQSELAADQVN